MLVVTFTQKVSLFYKQCNVNTDNIPYGFAYFAYLFCISLRLYSDEVID